MREDDGYLGRFAVTDFKSHLRLNARMDGNTALKRESPIVSRTVVGARRDLSSVDPSASVSITRTIPSWDPALRQGDGWRLMVVGGSRPFTQRQRRMVKT